MDRETTRLSFSVKNLLPAETIVVIEPWAHEFQLAPRSALDLTIEDDGELRAIEIKIEPRRTTVWVNTGTVMGATIDGREVWPN